jgi:DNA invertase Pin-like site-specific DNA recombinase
LIDRLSRNTEKALLIHRELEGRLELRHSELDKFTLTLLMDIADRERELIGLRTKQALDQKPIRLGEWRKGGPNVKKAAAGLIGAQTVKEMASENENSRRATALIGSLRKGGLS